MTPRQKKTRFIILLIVGIAIAIGLVLYALKQNIDLYYTPTQIAAGIVPVEKHCRIGGLVLKGSVHHAADANTSFVLIDIDNAHKTTVFYKGILPDLFREGQGIVAEGYLDQRKHFIADEVFAKHDEKYTPPIMENEK